MTLPTTAARGAVTTFAGQWSKFLVQTASVVVLARLLTPDDYGVVAMVTAVTGVAFLLGDFGLSLASIQAKNISQAQRSNLFWINLLIGSCTCATVFFCAPLLADFYHRPDVVDIARLIALMFLTEAACAQFRAESSRRFRFRSLAVSDVVSQAFGLAAAIVVAANGYGYWALVAQQLAISLGRLVVIAGTSSWWPGLPRRAPMRSFLTFGANTFGLQLVNYASSNADNVLIGRFLGGGELGLYSRAYQLFRLPLQQIASPLTRVAVPVLSRVPDDATYERYILRAQALLAYLLGGAFMVSAGVAVPLVSVLLGSRFADSAPAFAILAVGGVFQALGYVYYWVFTSKALTGVQLRVGVVSRVAMIGLMALGLLGGIEGVAAGATLGLALNWLLLTQFALPRSGLDSWKVARAAMLPVGLFLPASIVAYLASYPLTDRLGPWASLAVLLLGFAAYLLLAWAVVPRIRRDVAEMVSAAAKVRSRR